LAAASAPWSISSLDQVTIAAREYNRTCAGPLRQGRQARSRRHAAALHRQHTNLEEDLEIDDFEMSGIEVDKTKKMATATARVEYTWSAQDARHRRKDHDPAEMGAPRRRLDRRGEERVKGTPLVFVRRARSRRQVGNHARALDARRIRLIRI